MSTDASATPHAAAASAPRSPAPAASPADARFEKALRYLDRKVSRAMRDYGLVTDGDRILLALSGGKDSLVLLHALLRRREWRPERYDLVACHVQGGLCGGACNLDGRLAALCADLGVPYRSVRQQPAGVHAGLTPEELAGLPKGDADLEGTRAGRRLSPCFVCSWNRRKALFEAAQQEGCNRIAFGHHKDDIAETLLLNLLWQGRVESMRPRQDMFGGAMAIIRPLALVDEREIARLARLGGLPAHACPCPYAETSAREVAADLIRVVRDSGCRGVTDNLLRTALAAPVRDPRRSLNARSEADLADSGSDEGL